MKVALFGISAFSHWMSTPAASSRNSSFDRQILKDCTANRIAADFVSERFPQIPLPLHVLMSRKAKSPVSGAIAHVSTYPYKKGSFTKIGDGTFASSPELCFTQMATQLSPTNLAHAGNALCGTFYLIPGQKGKLGSRAALTSVRKIEMFLRKNPGIYGSESARAALKWMRDGFASPPESFLWLALALDRRRGGYGLRNLLVNRRLKVSRKAAAIAGRTTLVPDLCAMDERIAVEYDSNAEHLSARQLTRDATKRLALESDGFKVITVTALQLGNRREIDNIAKEIYRQRGARFRNQSIHFEKEQHRLFSHGWGLDAYFRREWLYGESGGDYGRGISRAKNGEACAAVTSRAADDLYRGGKTVSGKTTTGTRRR